MAGPGFLTASLVPAPLDASAFAGFGTVIDASGRIPEPINDGTTQRFSDLARLDLGAGGDPVLSIYVASARTFPLRIAKLEQHREASQIFIPLGQHRFIIVVAPGHDEPAWAHAAAFITNPGQAVALKRACWHHGLVALQDGDRFAVLEGANYRGDTIERSAPREIMLARPA